LASRLTKRVPLRLPIIKTAEFNCFITIFTEELRCTGGSATAVSKKDQSYVFGDIRHPVFEFTEWNMNRTWHRSRLDFVVFSYVDQQHRRAVVDNFLQFVSDALNRLRLPLDLLLDDAECQRVGERVER